MLIRKLSAITLATSLALTIFLGLIHSVNAQLVTWEILDNNIFYTNGNVGIGTDSPQYPLDITKRLMRLKGTVPAFILEDERTNGGNWAMYTGSPEEGAFKLRDNQTGKDRMTFRPEGYVDFNTKLLRLHGDLPAIVLDDQRTGTKDWGIYAGSPAAGDFKIRNINDWKDKFIIRSNGEVCIGNCN